MTWIIIAAIWLALGVVALVWQRIEQGHWSPREIVILSLLFGPITLLGWWVGRHSRAYYRTHPEDLP